MSNGTPEILIDALLEKGVKELTIIGNDSGLPKSGIGRLVSAGVVKQTKKINCITYWFESFNRFR